MRGFKNGFIWNVAVRNKERNNSSRPLGWSPYGGRNEHFMSSPDSVSFRRHVGLLDRVLKVGACDGYGMWSS